MTRCRAVVTIVLLMGWGVLLATAQGRSNEPFTSFRTIDKQLSLINARTAVLKDGSRVERIRSMREVRPAVARIRQRSQRLASLYRSRHQRFGVKLFSALDERALTLSRALKAVQNAKNKAERAHALGQFDTASLHLILQFQAISANYGASHCGKGQWTCCEPRRDPETNREAAQECKWICVAKASACSGFTGPQSKSSLVWPGKSSH